jgi:hypothetical protein
MTKINLSVELTEQEAWDYAQFLKRVGFSEFRTNAQDDDEAYRMFAVSEKIRRAINDLGINPR